jgi:hypothetical protein
VYVTVIGPGDTTVTLVENGGLHTWPAAGLHATPNGMANEGGALNLMAPTVTEELFMIPSIWSS